MSAIDTSQNETGRSPRCPGPDTGASARMSASGLAKIAQEAIPAILRQRKRAGKMNLALQGGGVHGAFTWGVLDALLEMEHIAFDGVSGTSAGAVNAVALAAGLMEGGPAGARAKLEEIWRAISRAGAPGSYPANPAAYAPGAAATGAAMWEGMQKLSDMMSPYDFNPRDINPLREILLAGIDFERLQRESPVKLFIAATEVTSGRARIFTNSAISAGAVLASACIPKYFAAVRIGRFHYWDGGFSANPDLTTLVSETSAGDTLLVRINPGRNPGLPVSRDEIAGNINRLTFDQPLRNQIQQIENTRRAARFPLFAARPVRRLARHRFHLVDGSRYTLKAGAASKYRPDWSLIENLKEDGRREAMGWIANGLDHVGRRSGVDLHAEYFTDQLPFD